MGGLLSEAAHVLATLPEQPAAVPDRSAVPASETEAGESPVTVPERELADSADVFPEPSTPTREELRAEAVRLHGEGLSRRQIVDATGLPLSTVQRAITKAEERSGTAPSQPEKRSGTRRVPSDGVTFVYFARQGEDGPIKIGRSDMPERRLVEMQTGNADNLRLIGLLWGDQSLEAEIHSRFADLSVRREWFEPGEELLEFIAAEASVVDAVLPDNFKSWGAVLWAYRSLERKMHELAQENARLRAENAELRDLAAGVDPTALRGEFERHRLALRQELHRALALDERVAEVEGVIE